MASADGWSATGREHESQGSPCQDAFAFCALDDRAMACVSDGCSGGKESELGSLALSRAALALFREGADFFSLPHPEALSLILERAQRSADALGFELLQAPATLLLLCHRRGAGQARALIWGDGFVGRARGGSLSLIESRCPGEMPFYPAYALDPAAEDAWARAGGSQILLPEGESDGLVFCADPREAWIDILPGDLAFVASDGAARAGALSAREALSEAGLIKSRAGRFLSRRMSRARQHWESQAARANERFAFGDDLSIAALLFDPAESEAL